MGKKMEKGDGKEVNDVYRVVSTGGGDEEEICKVQGSYDMIRWNQVGWYEMKWKGELQTDIR